MAEVLLESVYAPRAAEPGDDRARAYARWTLRGEGPRENDAAFAVCDKLLRRGALVLAPERLQRALARLLGARLQAGLRAASQVQQAALRYGAWTACATDLADAGPFTRAEASALLRLALQDFSRLWSALRALYPGEEAEAGPLFVSFTGAGKGGWDAMAVEEGWAGACAAEPFHAAEARAARAPAALAELLERVFGLRAFRPGQRRAVEALLEGRDAAALLPTGGGKSLIAQVAALLRPGTGLVIEPLLSVLEDQLRGLRRAGVGAAAAASEPGALEALAGGRLALVYVSPERLENAAFRDALRAAAESPGIGVVVVDEAHCVTAWGHDFRPALLSLGRRARRWSAGPGGEPPVLAMTGTASLSQLTRACAELEQRRPVLSAAPLSRPELSFAVERCGRGEHLSRLRAWLRREPGARFGSGLVFCPTVEGAAAARRVFAEERLVAGLYTGRAPGGEDAAAWDEDKALQARAFQDGRLDWLCCTSAFGLGVDVPRARFTAHLGLPSSLEAFFQEAGRAGRDGRAARCRIILHLADEKRARRWLDPARPWSAVAAEHAAASMRSRDDVWLSLRLHARAWPGLDAERRDLRLVAAALGPLEAGALRRAALPGQAPEPALRALGRLERAGLLELAGRGPGWFAVLARADASAAQAAEAGFAEAERVYAEAEPSRRASLEALVEACAAKEPGDALARALAGLHAGEAAVQGLVLEDGLVPG